MNVIQKLSLFVAFIVISPISNAQITAKNIEYHDGDCIWNGITLTPSDCREFRRNPARVLARFNRLPGKTDLDKMVSMVKGVCKQRNYRGGVVGEYMGLVEYCSQVDSFYPKRIKVIRSSQGETWVFWTPFHLMYVDAKSGIIKAVMSNR